MIELLTFAIGKSDFDKEYMISFENGTVYAEILNQNGHISRKIIVPKDYGEKLTPFENIGIYRWHKNYYVEPQNFKDNDINWALQYKEVGKNCRSISGYGKFPDNFDKLLNAIHNIFPSFKYKEFANM